MSGRLLPLENFIIYVNYPMSEGLLVLGSARMYQMIWFTPLYSTLKESIR